MLLKALKLETYIDSTKTIKFLKFSSIIPNIIYNKNIVNIKKTKKIITVISSNFKEYSNNDFSNHIKSKEKIYSYKIGGYK